MDSPTHDTSQQSKRYEVELPGGLGVVGNAVELGGANKGNTKNAVEGTSEFREGVYDVISYSVRARIRGMYVSDNIGHGREEGEPGKGGVGDGVCNFPNKNDR